MCHGVGVDDVCNVDVGCFVINSDDSGVVGCVGVAYAVGISNDVDVAGVVDFVN